MFLNPMIKSTFPVTLPLAGRFFFTSELPGKLTRLAIQIKYQDRVVLAKR